MSERDDISAYVLGELEPAVAERLRARERSDPGFAAEVAAVRALVAQIDELGPAEWDLKQPPPLRFAPPAAASGRSRRRALVLRPAVAALVALVLLAAGVGIGALVAGGGGSSGGRAIALSAVGPAPRDARGVARLGGTTMRLSVRGLPRAARGDVYEVWMMRSATDLVSVGTFVVGPDGRASVVMPVTASPRRYPFIDISLEPPDGNPAHSSISVLRSKAL
jgi:anti-sigma-K factor RskA